MTRLIGDSPVTRLTDPDKETFLGTIQNQKIRKLGFFGPI
jgi:hypothetical protein